MKNCLLILLLLVLPFRGVYAQVHIHNGISSFSLPPGTQRLSEKEFQTINTSKFSSEYAVYAINDSLFRVDDILFSFEKHNDSQVTRKTIENKKKIWTSVIKKGPNTVIDADSIVTFNNIRFFTLQYTRGNEGNILVFSDYDSQYNFLGIRLRYPAGDAQKASALIRQILGSFAWDQPKQ